MDSLGDRWNVMSEVVVQIVRTDAGGRLRVRPARPSRWNDYAFIYRDASCVRWDDTTFELFIDPLQNLGMFEAFVRIRTAVLNEYGDSLALDTSTVFENVPQAVILQIQRAAAT